MGRAGRKRKAGRRHPNGQLVRDKRPDDRIRVSRQPHRRVVRKDDRLDPKAESPLGRLNLRGVITPAQYDAGALYVKIVGEYRAVIETPKETAGSGRGTQCGIVSAGGGCLLEDCPCLKKQKRYTRAYRALGDAGRRAILAVNKVAVHGEAIAEEEIANLVLGLDTLARYFGLTDERKPTHSSNAN